MATETPESSETSVLDQVLQGMVRFKVQFQAAINAPGHVPGTIAEVWRRISEGHPDSTFSVFIKIIVIFGFGVLMEWLFRKKSIKMDDVHAR